MAGHAAEIDDGTAAVLRHVLAEDLRPEMNAGQVDVEDSLPILVGSLRGSRCPR